MFEPGRRRADALLISGLTLLLLASIGFFWTKTLGPTSNQTGTIIYLLNSTGGYGLVSDVTVQFEDGTTKRLIAPRKLLASCRIGDDIEIIIRRFSSEVSPVGCLASK